MTPFINVFSKYDYQAYDIVIKILLLYIPSLN